MSHHQLIEHLDLHLNAMAKIDFDYLKGYKGSNYEPGNEPEIIINSIQVGITELKNCLCDSTLERIKEICMEYIVDKQEETKTLELDEYEIFKGTRAALGGMRIR